jgi:hypothetical protein
MTPTDPAADNVLQAVFRALVEMQDAGTPVTASRRAVAKQFDLTEDAVKEVEREGVANDWPPLS